MNSTNFDEHIKKLRDETLKHNSVAQAAHKEDRDYIIPEDVHEAFKTTDETKVRLDVLEILGEGGTGFSMEASDLIAFVAFQGKEESLKSNEEE